MTTIRGAVALVLLLVGLAGCGVSPRDAWYKGLSRCASNDTLDNSTLVFLGPSNTYGPGSGWRRAPSGVLNSRFSLNSAMPNPAQRQSFVTRGIDADCQSIHTEEWRVSPSVVLTAVAPPIEAELGIDISRNKTVDVRVKTWRLDHLEELLYEKWMASDASGIFGEDLLTKVREPRFVMKSAVAVKGFLAILTLDAADSGKLDANLPVSRTANVGVNLQVTRTAHDRVEINSDGEFYIVGTFIPVLEGKLGAFPGGDSRLLKTRPTKFSSDTKIGHADIE